MTIGQTFVSQDNYTREGWLSNIWGKGQPTLLANGSTAAFYLNGIGLTAIKRRQSMAFKNFMSIVAIFKNGGYYFLKGAQNTDLFGVDRGRVISVMDLIKISYDGVEYIGSFNSFTLEETAEIPFRFTFNFEFVVSGLRGDPVEGHIKIGNNNVDNIILKDSGYFNLDEFLKINPNASDIISPNDTITQTGTETTSSGSSGDTLANVKGSTVISADIKKDSVAFLQQLQNLQRSGTIDLIGTISTKNQICRRSTLVNNMLNSVGVDDILQKLKAVSPSTVYTDDVKNKLIITHCIEQSDSVYKNYATNGTTPPQSSDGLGAQGFGQVQPDTYLGLLKDSTFRKFANSCGYDQSKISPDVALGSFSHRATNKYGKNYSVYSGGLLGSDAKFNTVVTAYLMQTGYMKSIKFQILWQTTQMLKLLQLWWGCLVVIDRTSFHQQVQQIVIYQTVR